MTVMAGHPVPPPPDERPDPSTVQIRRWSPSIPSVRCSARSKKAGGTRCPKWAMRGSTVCREHGGAAPATKAKAAKRLAEASAQADLNATLARMNLDADPVRDPTVALGTLAGRLLSGFEENVKRVNSVVEAGSEPSDYDVAERKLLVRELRQVLTDMTRLQIGVSLGMQYIQKASADGPAGDPAADQGELGTSGPLELSAPVSDVSDIVAKVLATEHELETERLVRVEAAKAQQVAPLAVVPQVVIQDVDEAV